MTACHHLRGGIWGLRLMLPACRHDPAWRNTGLRTAPTTYRGWKLHRLLSSSATSGVSTMASRPKPVFAAPGAAQRPPSAVGGDCRNADNLFISRYLRSCAGFIRYIRVCVPKVRPL